MPDTPLFDRNAYRIVENDKLNLTGIELLEEPYQGLVYTYGKVQFIEGEKHLNFQRNIVRPVKDRSIEELNNDKKLNNLMGDILVELIAQQAEEDNEQRSTKRTD